MSLDDKLLDDYSIVPNKEDLEKWKELEFNLAVIGDPTPLKHIFMNRLAGLSLDEAQSQENTLANNIDRPSVRAYSINANFNLWDLSSIQKEPDLFENSIADLEKYDVFILFREADFSQNDFNLVKEVNEKLKKRTYLVKLGIVESSKESSRNEVQPSQSASNVHIFTSLGDKEALSKLYMDIFQNLSDEEKKQTFLFSVEPISKEIVQEKSKLLAARAHNVALVSTLFGKLISMPGLSLIADIVLISSEIWFYRDQLGLNKKSFDTLKSKAKGVYESASSLVSNSKYASYLVLNDMHLLTELIIKSLPMLLNLRLTDWVTILPMIGSVLHNTASFSATKYTLANILEEFSKIAQDIQSVLTDQKRYEQVVKSYAEAKGSLREKVDMSLPPSAPIEPPPPPPGFLDSSYY